MEPTADESATTTSAMASPKRSLSPQDGEQSQSKRARIDSSDDIEMKLDESADPGDTGASERPSQSSDQLDFSPFISTVPSLHGQARQGIQRSVAMVLEHDGFDSATPEAMESFTHLVESCTSVTTLVLPSHCAQLTSTSQT